MNILGNKCFKEIIKVKGGHKAGTIIQKQKQKQKLMTLYREKEIPRVHAHREKAM